MNTKNKDLDPKISKFIVKAANEVMKGKHDTHFPLKVWHNRFWYSNQYECK